MVCETASKMSNLSLCYRCKTQPTKVNVILIIEKLCLLTNNMQHVKSLSYFKSYLFYNTFHMNIISKTVTKTLIISSTFRTIRLICCDAKISSLEVISTHTAGDYRIRPLNGYERKPLKIDVFCECTHSKFRNICS